MWFYIAIAIAIAWAGPAQVWSDAMWCDKVKSNIFSQQQQKKLTISIPSSGFAPDPRIKNIKNKQKTQ